MIELKQGKIKKLIFEREGIQAFTVEIEGNEEKCISYTGLTGLLKKDDLVVLNTTAVSLNLGTGGYHFVTARLESNARNMSGKGHIMKLRYTPLQLKVLSVEEEDSPYREEMLKADSLDNIPVLVGTLHSMLAPMCLYLHKKGLTVAYVMTDGASLPAVFSNTVSTLKQKGMLTGTVTVGHAFGGDLEAVNVYSGLLAARKVLKADVIICTMGPGIVGTGTRWGFTGVEQGEILNAVESLHGCPIAVPRISFADQRARHRGISHHTITVLSRVCRIKAFLALPELEAAQMTYILEQLRDNNLLNKYHCCIEKTQEFLDFLAESNMNFSTMGRGIDKDREFFLALGAAAKIAVRLHQGEKLNRIDFA